MFQEQKIIGLAAMTITVWLADAMAQDRDFDCVIEPNMVIDLGSAVDGIVEEILVARGDRVMPGQPVARLESAAERAALRIAEAQANDEAQIDLARNKIDLIEKEASRTQTLAAKNLTANNVLEAVMSELKQAQLELRLAQHRRNLAELEKLRTEAELNRRVIRSPIDGVVLRRLIGPGEYVYSQAQIAQIAKIDPLYVEVYLPTEIYPRINQNAEALVRIAEPIGGTHTARVIAIDKVFDAASDTFGVRLEMPNPGGLLPAGVDCQVQFP